MSDTTIGAQNLDVKQPQEAEAPAVDKKELDNEKAIGGKKAKNFLKAAGKKLAQPVVDQFHKDYGEDAEATPKTVADFIFDHAVKLGVVALTIGVTFAATKGRFNGFTKNFSQNLETDGVLKAAKNALSQVKLQNAEAVVNANNIKNATSSASAMAETLAGTAAEVMENKGAAVAEAAEGVIDAAANGKTGIIASLKKIFSGTPKEAFAENSKLPKIIDKFGGKHADKIKESLLKAGIGEGADVVDNGLAAASTALAAASTGTLASNAVDGNDHELGINSKLEKLGKALETVEKLVG